MIKLYSLYNQKIVTDITGFCKTIQWSGDKSQAARKLDVTLTYSIWDKNQINAQVGVGTFVWLVDEKGIELFRGIVFDRELNSTEELKFTAYDFLIYFNKSKVSYNFKNIVAENAVLKMCKDLEVKCESLPKVSIQINRIFKEKGAYDALMTIYTDISKINGKQYIPIMDKDMLTVIEKGKVVSNFILKPEVNMGQTTYTDSIENMINKVLLYDENENYIGEFKNDDWIQSYGILQDIYNTGNSQNNNVNSNYLLHGVDETVNIVALGDTRCITGYSVETKISYVEMLQDVTLFIDSDTHTWEVGSEKYTMELTLNKDNIMDRKEDS